MTEHSTTQVRIVSSWARLGLAIASELEITGRWRCLARVEEVEGLRLMYGPGVSLTTLRQLCRDIEPLEPELDAVDELEDTAVLEIGPAEPPDQYNIVLYSDIDELVARVRASLEGLGFRITRVKDQVIDESQLAYGGASAIARQLIRRVLAAYGVRVNEEKRFGDEDNDIHLYMIDEQLAKLPPRQRRKVRVFCDDDAVAALAADRLAAAGFERVQVMRTDELPDAVEPDELRFMAAAGPFEGSLDGARLVGLADELHSQLGVDAARYPLKVKKYEAAAYIALPVTACRGGLMPVYGGPFVERFKVKIFSDHPHQMADLQSRLSAEGFARVEVEGGSHPGVDLLGFTLRVGAAAEHPEIMDKLRVPVEETMRSLGAGEKFELRVEKGFSDGDPDVWILVPVEGVADGSLAERIHSPASYDLTIKCKETSEVSGALMDNFRGMGFRSLQCDTGLLFLDDHSAEIAYGGAPGELIDRVIEELSSVIDVAPSAKKEWGSTDKTIHVSVGPAVRLTTAPAGSVPGVSDSSDLDLGAWIADVASLGEAPPAPFVEALAEGVRVGTVVLERWPGSPHPLAPAPALFHHYCLDRTTAETLHFLATCVVLREASLLEGETSTSKTSSIQYLASLLGQPVVRLNLNGQTDTGDLIGRWVPRSLGDELPFTTSELGEAASLLETETRMILERATREQRALNRVEVHQIVANERIRRHPWSWQDGLVVQAVRHGWWVILDEVNLAEPQILERLNSLLEREPQLVLSEYDGSVFGPGGTPVHPRFRIFATMNPAEYAGRTALSPAYRNRWRGYRIVSNPDERAYEDMLRLVVFGAQPHIGFLGRTWIGPVDNVATHGVLADVPGFEDLLHALARFQVALENASGQRVGSRAKIGVRRKERCVFTRRDLLSVMDYLASPLFDGATATARAFKEAVVRYYLDRVAADDDRRLVVDLLDAAGIGPGTWAIEMGLPADEEAAPERAKEMTGLDRDAAPEPDTDLEVDPDATLGEIAGELRSLLVALKATGTLSHRAKALCDALEARFERPSSEALRDFDRAVKRGAVEAVVKAARSGADTDFPWILAGMVKLRQMHFPGGDLMKLVSKVCERNGE